jgi:hypothetical protein
MTSSSSELSYDHECAPPPVDVAHPDRRFWYCPDCGTRWAFIRKVVDRRVRGGWRPIASEADRLRRQLAALRRYLDSGALPQFYVSEINKRLEDAAHGPA